MYINGCPLEVLYIGRNVGSYKVSSYSSLVYTAVRAVQLVHTAVFKHFLAQREIKDVHVCFYYWILFVRLHGDMLYLCYNLNMTLNFT